MELSSEPSVAAEAAELAVLVISATGPSPVIRPHRPGPWSSRFLYFLAAMGVQLLLTALAFAGPPVLPGSSDFAEQFAAHTEGDLTVYTPRDRVLPVVWLQRRAESVLLSLSNEMGVDPGGAMDVVFAGDEEVFQWVTGGLVPEWGTGAALPGRRLVIIAYSNVRERTPEELDRVLRHEFAHVLLGSLQVPIPRWFDEGHAMFRSQLPSPDMHLALSRAALFDRLLPLPALADSFPASEPLARLAYAESYDAIRWIEERYGPQALPWILSDLAVGRTFPDALERGTGLTPALFAAVWKGEVRSRFNLIDVLGESGVLWALVGVVLVVGAILKRARGARRSALWEDDDSEILDAGEEWNDEIH